MNKKIIAVTLIGILSLGLTACNSNNTTKEIKDTKEPTKVVETGTSTTEIKDLEKVSARTMDEIKEFGEYRELEKAEFVVDSADKVTITFTVAEGTTEAKIAEITKEIKEDFADVAEDYKVAIPETFELHIVSKDHQDKDIKTEIFDNIMAEELND